MMNIGQAADASGITAKMIRHYESIGLIDPARRSEAGYRLYDSKDLNTLRFIRQSRALGFSLSRIRTLLELWQNRDRSSKEVKALATEHIAELEQKIRELEAIKSTLSTLVKHCHGDDRPECPILEGLACHKNDINVS